MTTFSVIMNCLNGERFLKEAIDSVYDQTFKDWEIIFFDSGSTDKSVEIATSYGSRIKIFTLEKPVPLGQARQEAVDKASGDFLAFLDVDDVWLPFKLQVQYNLMKSGDYDICYGGVQCIDERGKLLHKNMPIHSSGVMFEKQLFQSEGCWSTYIFNRAKVLSSGVMFNPTYKSTSEPDFTLRFLATEGTGAVLHQVLAKYRIWKSSVTFNTNMVVFEHERFEMFERLLREKPEIKDLFPEAYTAAEARGYYYKARYLIDQKKNKEAAEAMSVATKMDKDFLLLSILIHWPWLWNFVHRFKGYLAPFWLKLNL